VRARWKLNGRFASADWNFFRKFFLLRFRHKSTLKYKTDWKWLLQSWFFTLRHILTGFGDIYSRIFFANPSEMESVSEIEIKNGVG
jgi:hypothetical protein